MYDTQLTHVRDQTPHQFLFIISLFKHLLRLCVGDGDFNLYTWFDADGGDLLDDFRWAVQIDQALVDPHLEAIPGFGALTTGSLSGGDAQSLGRGRENKIIREATYNNSSRMTTVVTCRTEL